MNAPTPTDQILDGMSDSLSDLQRRVDHLESQVRVLRDEISEQIEATAFKLRDDSDFTGPYWRGGLAHVSDHIFTRVGRWLLSKVAFAVGAACLAAAAYWHGVRR